MAGASQTLLVCKPTSFLASGAKELLASHLPNNVVTFSDFSPNPKEADVVRGVDLFRHNTIKSIVAVGGGSALDMAKLIRCFGSTGQTLDDYLAGKLPVSAETCPMLAIPTTAGSGSEATHFAVLYRAKQKYSIADASILPTHSLLIPELTHSLSAYQTACCGMDALAQGIESHWARGGTDESRQYAQHAIDLAMQHLERAVNAPTPEHRAAMMEAAHYAGRAINISKTTAAHAFSYILTSEFGLPHGHAVGVLLPHFIRHHAEHGVYVKGVNLSDMELMLHTIGLDFQVKRSAAALFRLLQTHVNVERLGNNPVGITDTWIMRIAEQIATPQSSVSVLPT